MEEPVDILEELANMPVAERIEAYKQHIETYRKLRNLKDNYFIALLTSRLEQEWGVTIGDMIPPEEDIRPFFLNEADTETYKKITELKETYFANLTQDQLADVPDESLVEASGITSDELDDYQQIRTKAPTPADVETYKKVRELGDEYFFNLSNCR